MKKAFSFALGLVVAISALFVSCADGGNDGGGNNDLFCNVSVTNTVGGSVSITDYLDNSSKVLIGADIEVVANPESGYEFIGWFIDNSTTPVSTNTTFKFVASRDVTLTAKFDRPKVDLGLPSGIKWAAYNVGATKPEEYGGYYAWGETEEKTDYSWDTYKWMDENKELVKYCDAPGEGIIDNKTILEPQDDVAHVKWGGNWRMPTAAEQQELIDNCDWVFTTLNGVEGYKVIATNGNSIFFPSSGCRYRTNVYAVGVNANMWSSSLDTDDSIYANYIFLNNESYKWDGSYTRYYGFSVRPVCTK